ncbi:hypothetical protein ACFL60_03830 [Candidatus Omnitrophota bacterium]
MKTVIAELIVPFAEVLYAIVFSIPLWAVRAFVFAILAALAVWILKMPPQLPEADESTIQSKLADLRYFALAVITLQALLYVIF